MINNSSVLLFVKDINKYYLINRLVYNNVFYYDLNTHEEYISFKTSSNNIKLIKNIFGYNKVTVEKYYGKKGIIKFIKTHYIFLICVLWGLFLINILSNMIFNIEIVSTDIDMIKIITKELESNGIKKYKFKKSYDELSKIKENILENNKTTLEWLEIESYGTKYVVEFTPRVIIEEEKEDNKLQNIVSSKDALIMHIESDKGEVIREVNDYVKKGEVIISGNIIRGEDKIVAQVKASGKVYGEVWYLVNVTIPYRYTEYVSTDKIINHYYIKFLGKKMTIMGKYDTKYVMSEKETVISKPYLLFEIIKERKRLFEYREFQVTKKEAIEEAVKRSENSIKVTLDKEEYIIDKKVLKIDEFSSKINVEVFFKVYENITKTSNLEKFQERSKDNDKSNNKNNR